MPDLPPKYAPLPGREGTLAQLLEALAAAMSGGQSQQERAFYNTTRAGLANPNTLPEGARSYGGLGMSLGDRREMQGYQSQNIAHDVRSLFPPGSGGYR